MDNKRIVLTVEFPDKKITLEGPEDFVRDQMLRLRSLPPDDVAAHALSPSSADDIRPRRGERDLIAEKKPQGHAEIAAVLAFHMSETGVDQFSEAEMKRAYIRAGIRPPKVIAQALRDAKNKYDYLASGDERGLYRLSDHGERLVRIDLPRRADA